MIFFKYNETCETGLYPPDPSTVAPEYVVNLDLPPEQRWAELSAQYQKPVI